MLLESERKFRTGYNSFKIILQKFIWKLFYLLFQLFFFFLCFIFFFNSHFAFIFSFHHLIIKVSLSSVLNIYMIYILIATNFHYSENARTMNHLTVLVQLKYIVFNYCQTFLWGLTKYLLRVLNFTKKMKLFKINNVFQLNRACLKMCETCWLNFKKLRQQRYYFKSYSLT